MAGLRDLARVYPEVKIFAISPDKPDETRDFARKMTADGHGAAGFEILSDPRSATIDRYGLRDPEYAHEKINGVPHPAVFVLDAQDHVRWEKIESDYRERPTNEEVAAALDSFD